MHTNPMHTNPMHTNPMHTNPYAHESRAHEHDEIVKRDACLMTLVPSLFCYVTARQRHGANYVCV